MKTLESRAILLILQKRRSGRWHKRNNSKRKENEHKKISKTRQSCHIEALDLLVAGGLVDGVAWIGLLRLLCIGLFWGRIILTRGECQNRDRREEAEGERAYGGWCLSRCFSSGTEP